jgi:hypothetical protein
MGVVPPCTTYFSGFNDTGNSGKTELKKPIFCKVDPGGSNTNGAADIIHFEKSRIF